MKLKIRCFMLCCLFTLFVFLPLQCGFSIAFIQNKTDDTRNKSVSLNDTASFDVSVLPLAKGDKGDNVKELQKRLISFGYSISDPEGEFGNSTKNAVFMYQDDHGLTATGVFDKETYLVIIHGKHIIITL